jgi:SEC-C motif-containing protein
VPESTHSTGRNDPCHCGSGKKYKLCCLGKDEAAEREARAKQVAEATESAEKSAAPPPKTPKHNTQQPWKGPKNTRGFQRLNIPRRSGGS